MSKASAKKVHAQTVEGRRAVLEALRAKREITRLLMAEGIELGPQLSEVVFLAGQQDVPVDAVSRAELDRVSHTGKHQSVIAIVSDPRYSSIEEIMLFADQRGEPPLVVALDGVQDPHNFGAVARTADAAGAHGVIIPERRAAGVTPGAVRASAGALEHVLVAREPNLARAVKYLGQLGLKRVGLDADGPTPLFETDLTGPVAIVVGSEGRGMTDQVRKECDELISIPMYGEIASLNASVSAAIVLYEAVRQRAGRSG
ncbi:MAG: 23S rRNA (guanosine(2251)-2'-O)-methyltransferase RlmB [Chloroflexi bacterium]|nr:23S rRNA (guanosine(2251)-2'-O)-methyltransferase RlmB [Chloroflexota bacterium]